MMKSRTTFSAVGALATVAASLALFAAPPPVQAGHNGLHATPCDASDTVGGGTFGNSPGAGLGWDVGSGQCNGSFAKVTDLAFPSDSGGGIELGMRIEQRRVGQVTRNGANDYEVQLGNDTTAPPALNRAWWNFQHSIAYDGNIGTLDSLTFKIRTDVGPNLPGAPSFDMFALRPFIDARNTNSTTTYKDLYQTSANPDFPPWFAPTSDTDANPDGDFNYDEEGAWRMTLTAEKDGVAASVTICVHTPNADCLADDYACYPVDERTSLPWGTQVSAADQFTTQDGVEILEAREICAPTDKDNGGILNPDLHLVCYDVSSNEEADATVRVTNQFTTNGPQELRVESGIERICVPSIKEVLARDQDDGDDDDDRVDDDRDDDDGDDDRDDADDDGDD